ncbi:hypothetical protein [Noviherbaspirillum aridicola]|uniref:Uncharacterized protein n=1 Tax=Noviherbaspirillum aridicola TaxID=2849687 RepID=A0ABQ4Q0Y1_9BURK|nr:hypothetical protein [Noviherbaspirillum aridicola]GIZ50717.1 hypothetical protein NCCP691_07310 [Noviherbaspirillum aridicola]
MTHDYLLGNAVLHARFIATTQILAKMVSRAPRALSISQLEDETGRPARELGKLCHALGRAGVLCRDGECLDRWRLAGEPSEVTLEDVFRCIVEQQTPARPGKPEAAASEVDLLLMQAMIAINQSVSTQLRRFSLDRVRASSSAPFPLPRRAALARGFEDEAIQDSPVHAAA